MADTQRTAQRAAKQAQAQYERNKAGLQSAEKRRRDTFAQAQKAGLSLRQIAEATGLHWTRIGQIIRGK